MLGPMDVGSSWVDDAAVGDGVDAVSGWIDGNYGDLATAAARGPVIAFGDCRWSLLSLMENGGA